MVGSTISHYRILEELGAGGMGVVYKAEDLRLQRPVAMKFLPRHLTGSEEEKVRLLLEARSASALSHPNISHIYEVDEVGGEAFIAMEFIDGGSLRALLDAGLLNVEDAVRIAVQIAEGLKAAHEKGIVHRDIKPENILITKRGDVKISDFGLSLALVHGQATDGHQMAGTIAYMSPEQLRGDPVDFSSDIWAVGVILYEMLAGRLPFAGEYEQAVRYSILNECPHRLSQARRDVPTRLERIVDRCLEKDGSARYRDLAETLRDLKGVQADLAGLGVTAGPAKKSIAVLPFADISPEKDNKYFSDGLTEEIIASLSKLKELRVISRTSVMRYERAEKNMKQIAAELGAQFVLEGSVRKHGNDLRITAELIDADQDASLWAEKFRGSLEQIFDIQEEVASRIVDALSVKLSPDESRNIRKRFTDNADAYQLYLKGRFFWNRRNNQALTTAIRYFEQAIEHDRRYALVWAGLADAHLLRTETDEVSSRDALQKAREAVNEALRLDPQLAEAHATLGLLLMLDSWDWTGARTELKTAIQLDPNYPTAHHWLAEWYSLMELHDDALREISIAAELDPVSQAILKDKGMILYYARRFEEAVDLGVKALELDPNFASVHRLLSLAYEALGRFEEAANENRLWGEHAGNPGEAAVGLGYILARSGRREEALRTVADIEDKSGRRGNLLRGMALVHAALGEHDSAFEMLERSFALHADSLCTLKVDPKVDPLRKDPRFHAITKRVGLTE